MSRKDTQFPFVSVDFAGYFERAWKEGHLDEYSDSHFLIQALENRLTSIQWKEQLINNDNYNLYSPIKGGDIDYDRFSEIFIINLSRRLLLLEETFGKEPINNFVSNQLAAGKDMYDKDAFFQALTEVEILSFYAQRHKWEKAIYEPTTVKGGKNPEASFESDVHCTIDGKIKKVKINIEVKTPKFPDANSNNTRVMIPNILLSDNGRIELDKLCKNNGYKLLMPRVTKLIEFINSAVGKFNNYSEDEINLLYINWSYSDFPSNSFLEAWSLLTNEINGLLTNPSCAEKLSLRIPLSKEVSNKISAIIVYTSSLEQLMFSDFRFSWVQSREVGPHFRMYVLDEKLRNLELNNESTLLFNITGMNPDRPKDKEWRLMINNAWNNSTSIDKKAKDCKTQIDALDIISNNLLV